MKELLKTASEAYYDGNPILTNEQYDTLERMYGQTISGNGDTPHAFRMYSLQKCYDMQDAPLNIERCTETPKLDGAAISILYVQGNYTLSLTRGDGFKGRDITDKIRQLIPHKIETDKDLVQITGEVVCSHTMPNARNYVSGALNLKDFDEYSSKVVEGSIEFVAYSVQTSESSIGITTSYPDDMKFLYRNGFLPVTELQIEDGLASAYGTASFLTDGIVYRLSSNAQFKAHGFTSKFPKGAFAFKENAEAVETTLLDVVWQTGKSGKVSPVAILEPVMVGDAKVSRATLNNIEFIKALDLEIGCKVGIVRSGEIIPCVVSRID